MSAREQTTRYPGIYSRGSRYVVVTRGRDGKRIKRSAATMKAARELQATLKADILRGQHRANHALTFEEYAREWISTYQGRTTRGFREPTRMEYRRSIEKKAIPWFAEHCARLVDAEPRELRRFLASLQAEGRSLSTVRNHFNVVGALFATAVEDGLMPHNPCASVRVSRVEAGSVVTEKKKARALGEQEIAALLAEAGEWRAMLEFLIHTGLRIGEALELKWSDIEFGERPVVKVRRQTRRGVTNAPKTEAGRRDVPLSTSVARRLWASQGAPSGPVFGDPATGEHMPYHRSEYHCLRAAKKRAGLEWVTFHSLRHTCASLLFANGKNLKQVQHWLGHSSPVLTQNTYLHLMDDGLGEADFLDGLTGAGWGQSGDIPIRTPAASARAVRGETA
ncbi:MAG: site-specific integrase [Solirubrobacteraceae bacterium]